MVQFGASSELLGQLVDGPLDRRQVYQIATRLMEISRDSARDVVPRCRFGQQVDAAAVNLYNWLTRGADTNSSEPAQLIEDTDDDTRESDYCEAFITDSSRRRVSLQTMQTIVNLSDRNASLKTIQAKYKWYRPRDLPRFRACVTFGGDNVAKMDRINQHVLDRVREARLQGQPVHDYIIQQWGRQFAAEIGADSFFRASHTWVDRFKIRFGIRSRAVTSYTSRFEQDQRASIDAAINEFLRQFARLEAYFTRRLIWNYDQTGFNYEIVNKRTLSWMGERDTVLDVNSKSKTTHSYTSQPMISRSGSTVGKLLLCFREPATGDFPPSRLPYIRDLERQYRNIKVVASKSGKMTSNLMEVWVREVLLPAMRHAMDESDNETIIDDDEVQANETLDSEATIVSDDNSIDENYQLDRADNDCYENAFNEESYGCFDFLVIDRCSRNAATRADSRCRQKPDVLLIADSWTGQSSTNFHDRLRRERIKLLQIPRRTTAELQPLDINFNRQYKKFVKRVTERAIQEKCLQNITTREGLMNMHSLIWNQFSSFRYQDMIRHAWHNTDPGYSTRELSSGPPVHMVQDIQFEFDPRQKCQFNCSNHAFIKCSHCGKFMCLEHFLERNCFHHHTNNGTDPDDTDSDSGHDELISH